VALRTDTSHQIGEGLWIVCGALALFVSARHALGAGRVDSERLFAALSTYLLAGLILGTCYWVMESLSPGSFASASGRDIDFSSAVYFSFVTIATLGYGDITPVSDAARGMAVFEAVGGQMYMVVLVARLVALHVSQASEHRR
jgi:voltage-gated potassium channel Kch